MTDTPDDIDANVIDMPTKTQPMVQCMPITRSSSAF